MSAALALPRAVLDSNVIYSRVLHELMGRVALEGRFVDLIWSAALLEEAERVLIDGKGLAPHVAKRWIDHLPSSFPEGEVKDLEVPSDVDLASMTNDPGDHHVCALAIAGHAQLLFTFDRGYLRSALAEHGVQVVGPDPWLSAAIEDEPEVFAELIRHQAAAWGGGRPVAQLIDA